MAHNTTTYTLVSAFWTADGAPGSPDYQGGLDSLVRSYVRDGVYPTQAENVAHDLMVRATAVWLGQWLASWRGSVGAERSDAENVGFTAQACHGGGAGWPTERGVVLTLAGLTPADRKGLVEDLAVALKGREGQEAVLVLARVEAFDLV
jgi:hypothetical protein